MRRDNNKRNGSDYTSNRTTSGDRKHHQQHQHQQQQQSTTGGSTQQQHHHHHQHQQQSSSPRYRATDSSSHQNQHQQHHQHHQHQHQHHHHQHQHHQHHDSSTETYYFPGAASLSDHIDTRVMIILRDGKKLVGTLRSYDQFANMVLEDTVERIVVGKNFGDYPLGLYMVRGENVVLMGEIDEVLEGELESKSILNRVSLPQILQEQKELKESQMLLQQQKENGFDV